MAADGAHVFVIRKSYDNCDSREHTESVASGFLLASKIPGGAKRVK